MTNLADVIIAAMICMTALLIVLRLTERGRK